MGGDEQHQINVLLLFCFSVVLQDKKREIETCDRPWARNCCSLTQALLLASSLARSLAPVAPSIIVVIFYPTIDRLFLAQKCPPITFLSLSLSLSHLIKATFANILFYPAGGCPVLGTGNGRRLTIW